MQLRPYQQEAREAVQAEWAKGRKRTLLVLPTGMPSTIDSTLPYGQWGHKEGGDPYK